MESNRNMWGSVKSSNFAASSRPVSKNSALAKIKARRAVENGVLTDQNLNA
jgi:hypothetical protein